MWNVTFPFVNSDVQEGGIGTYRAGRQIAMGVVGADTNFVILKNTELYNNYTGLHYCTMDGFNAETGAMVWSDNITMTAYDTTFSQYKLDSGGVIICADKSQLSVTAYSESTGQLLWTTYPYDNAFALQSQSTGMVANGMLYDPGYDGYLHALNITNGVQVWQSHSAAGGLEMPQPYYPFNSIQGAGTTPANSVIYTTTAKSYEAQPLYRGHLLYAFNGMTGAQIWNISGQWTSLTIADGIMVGVNTYDGETFAFGAGATATTTLVPETTQVGVPVIIQGTVTDQTPAFAGTPCVSDQWMSAWMEYLTMDQPYPNSATGVNVQITAIDANNNLINIGNATTSTTSGLYKYTWTPPDVPGSYTIITTFSSDNSYIGSCGLMATYVEPPTAATPAPTSTPTSVADMYFVPAIAGLFILIIVVAIVLALLMLRKKA